MSDNKGENAGGIDLSSLQNADFSSLMSSLMKNVDMDKFKSVLSSLNMNDENMDKIMEAVSAPAAAGENAKLDINQLNSLASNVLKNMDATKLQSVVSNMAGENANAINGIIGSLLSTVKETATPVANTTAANTEAPNTSNLTGMLNSLLSGANTQPSSQEAPSASMQNIQNLLSKFKPPVDLANAPVAMVGTNHNDLKSQFEALLGNMNMDPATKEKISDTLDNIISKPMVSIDALKNGLGGINLQQLTPMLSNLMESFKSQNK